MIGWVFFRADNIVQASEFVQVLFGVGSSPICNNSFIMYINDYGYIIILSIIFAIPIIPKLKSILKSNKKLVESNFVYMLHSTFLVALMFIVVVILINSTYNPFLYFRF